MGGVGMETYKLSDLCEILDAKRKPLSALQRAKKQGIYPYYGAQGIIDHLDEYLLDGEYLLVAEDGANLDTRNQPIANIAKGKIWVNNHAHVLGSNGKFPLNLLGFILNNMNISPYVTGCAQPKLNQENLRNIEIELPSHIDSIASILSSLDRKIELNNKINADLEEMAQAIFKNWFVDFEPFKDGKFVDSELGMIPEGWKVGTLGELCNFKRGKNLLTKNAIDEGVPVVAGGLEPSCYHNVANTGAPVITVSGSGANAGFMRMYHVPVWASDCSFIDISCENFYFVYCFLKVNSKLLKHAQTGAVQPHVKPSDIHDFELVIPDKESIFDFQDKVKPFFEKIASIQKENSRLSLLRDTLLPRLMSGEIEVPD